MVYQGAVDTSLTSAYTSRENDMTVASSLDLRNVSTIKRIQKHTDR